MSGSWNESRKAWRRHREFVSGRIKITLRGAPWGGGKASVDSLDPLKLVFSGNERRVHAFVHQMDGEYLYSRLLSDEFSADYDKSKNQWGQTSYELGHTG